MEIRNFTGRRVPGYGNGRRFAILWAKMFTYTGLLSRRVSEKAKTVK